MVAEWLDSLPPDDPEALRSRLDLRVINFLMGNDRWIISKLRSVSDSRKNPLRIFELGAGDGALCRKVAACFPSAEIHAFDLLTAPRSLPGNVRWSPGDIRKHGPPSRREGGRTNVLICNMFLHHFSDDELPAFLPWFSACDYAFISEPLRSPSLKWLGRLYFPFCNRVTRHDMFASIDAGFRHEELAELMGLPHNASFTSVHAWPGAFRSTLCTHETP